MPNAAASLRQSVILVRGRIGQIHGAKSQVINPMPIFAMLCAFMGPLCASHRVFKLQMTPWAAPSVFFEFPVAPLPPVLLSTNWQEFITLIITTIIDVVVLSILTR